MKKTRTIFCLLSLLYCLAYVNISNSTKRHYKKMQEENMQYFNEIEKELDFNA